MITVYDTTLRDGTQREGMSLSVEDKLRIATRLDLLGFHYIEGGFPGSNLKDIEFFKRVVELELKNAVVSAFGSTRHKDTLPEDDTGLTALLGTGCEALCIFGKAWTLHVTETLRATLDQNLDMVRDSVAFLKAHGRTVFFDAEHFFDGYRADPSYALEVCRAAVEVGADAVVLCDTNGGTLPHEIARIVAEVAAAVAAKANAVAPVNARDNARPNSVPVGGARSAGVSLGIHAHDDSGCAVANSLLAVEAGCVHVQGTMNGYGERAGNANLATIVSALELKMGLNAVGRERLKLFTEASHYVAEIANIAPNPYQPYVGASVFAHKGGVHASAVARLPEAYEHVDASAVGNLARVVVSELAGRTSLVLKAKEMGIELVGDSVADALDAIKDLEYRGYSFEAADGSLELMLRKRLGIYEPLFRLESLRVIAEKREDGKVMTEATLKIHCQGNRFIATAEGNGPVNALDKALRIAISRFYPRLEEISLVDFKVRVLDERKGTGAVTRVLIESADSGRSWGTVGVSENIIEASWEALVDSIEYGLARASAKPTAAVPEPAEPEPEAAEHAGTRPTSGE
ncbi:MAG: citramalate synthase [Coriobacteriia bacterium]|nr:citramalate synthase [Coriobacteriia bacterium]